MAGRPKITRNITDTPLITGFKPYGSNLSDYKKEPIILHFEEYESFRLNDYLHLNQSESAVQMCISRPTYTRIYKKARQKIAKAFVEGRQIIVQGGPVCLDQEWRSCLICDVWYHQAESDLHTCPLCSADASSAIMAIACTEKSLTGTIAPGFGRADYFAIYEVKSNRLDFIVNPNRLIDGDAGIKSVDLILEKNANIVISGSYGIKIKTKMNTSGIAMVIAGRGRRVKDFIITNSKTTI